MEGIKTEFPGELDRLCLRIENAADANLARWMVEQAGVESIRAAAFELTSRKKPKPAKVAQMLDMRVPAGLAHDALASSQSDHGWAGPLRRAGMLRAQARH